MSQSFLHPKMPTHEPYVLITFNYNTFILPYAKGMEMLNILSKHTKVFDPKDYDESHVDVFHDLKRDFITYRFMTQEEYSDRSRAQTAGISYKEYMRSKKTPEEDIPF